MLAVIGLFPICLSLAASFSYDVFVITLSFIFIAMILKLIYSGECLEFKTAIPPIIVAVLLAPAKAIYLPLLLLLLLIPYKKYTNSKRVVTVILVALVIASLLWAAFNTNALRSSIGEASTISSVDDASGLLPSNETYEVANNNESKQTFTLSYILRHLPQTILLVTRSFIELSGVWLQGLIGGRLGEIIAINIEVSWILIISLIFLVFFTLLEAEDEHDILKKKPRVLMLFTSLLVVFLSIFVCITWTPINYTTIFGVQGRYFVPVLPLFLLAIRQKNLTLKKPRSETILFSCPIIVILVALQAFTIIVRR